tara:strand:- start:39 stop:335 length:297 start_codon:yes stop_codon:yes gene_type:complete
MIKYIDAIIAINSNAKVIIKNEDLDQIRWLEGTTPISKEDIQTKYDELVSAYNNDYKRKRKAEYPSIEELVVALYDTDDKAAIDAKRAAVKAKYPKGS